MLSNGLMTPGSVAWELLWVVTSPYASIWLRRKAKCLKPDRKNAPTPFGRGEHARCHFPESGVNDNTGFAQSGIMGEKPLLLKKNTADSSDSAKPVLS